MTDSQEALVARLFEQRIRAGYRLAVPPCLSSRRPRGTQNNVSTNGNDRELAETPGLFVSGWQACSPDRRRYGACVERLLAHSGVPVRRGV